ncbi:CLUMA_CG004283, isoform A [Clunio marinus]|uniref:CLUMA_CG004283, isoform A n=1 Tax=Clunio marinus TaxID=568069 RepID=A0A1J1HRD1_9DIPT|nr:CLUMA_CG004283, isoform A [Clunio marinus]
MWNSNWCMTLILTRLPNYDFTWYRKASSSFPSVFLKKSSVCNCIKIQQNMSIFYIKLHFEGKLREHEKVFFLLFRLLTINIKFQRHLTLLTVHYLLQQSPKTEDD